MRYGFVLLGGLLAIMLIALTGRVALDEDIQVIYRDLEAGETSVTQTGPQSRIYTVPFIDDAGEIIATASFDVDQMGGDAHRLRVVVEHEPETRLTTLRLAFATETTLPPDILLVPPRGEPWPPMIYRQVADDRSVVVDIPSLDVQGVGTVALDFLLPRSTTNESVERLDATLAFAVADQVVSLTLLQAETEVEISLE